MEGIKKRWVYNYIILLASVLLILEGFFVVFVQNYYHKNIIKELTTRVEMATDFSNRFLENTPDNLDVFAKKLLQSNYFKESLEMQVLDDQGNIVMSSSGFTVDEKIATSDYQKALEGSSTIWTGTNKITEEKLMSVSSPLKQSGSNKTVGVLRYVTSLENVNSVIRMLIISSLIVILVILAAMMLLSLIFSKSIIRPLNEINEVAKKMANGQFSERIEKRYNDEIGELADTINYMAKEILETAKIKNDFISSISHELRTPLTSIRGWGETILTGGLEDKGETELGLKIITKEATRLSHMVEDLLDFSKIESGRITLHLEPVDVESVLSDIVHMFKHKAQKDEVVVEYNNPEFIPEIIADADRLKQVFINVIDNAIKFTESGNRVKAIMASDDERVYIKIKDEGLGISEEDLPKVKDKFFKGSSKKSGSGIGLALSDEIIKLHGGTFEIESEIDEGTIITISLPISQEKNF